MAAVLKHQQRLFVFYARSAHLDKVVGMAIYQQQIRVTVVVIIEEPQSPTAQHLRCGSYFSGLIRKSQILPVVIKTEELSIDVRHKEILPAIAIIVCRVYSHSRARFAVLTEGYPSRQSDFFKFSAALIDE